MATRAIFVNPGHLERGQTHSVFLRACSKK